MRQPFLYSPTNLELISSQMENQKSGVCADHHSAPDSLRRTSCVKQQIIASMHSTQLMLVILTRLLFLFERRYCFYHHAKLESELNWEISSALIQN